MAMKKRSQSILLKLSLLLFCFSLLSSALAITPGTGHGFSINGRVKIPIGLGAKGFGLPGKLSNFKVILNGDQRVTFLKPDGYFSLNPGKVQAALTENRRGLTELVLEPLREEQYYEIREPFSIMSIVKSPMGLMMGFMLIMVFLMPKLVENMDSEEMRRAQEDTRNQGVPSPANMLPGAARS